MPHWFERFGQQQIALRDELEGLRKKRRRIDVRPGETGGGGQFGDFERLFPELREGKSRTQTKSLEEVAVPEFSAEDLFGGQPIIPVSERITTGFRPELSARIQRDLAREKEEKLRQQALARGETHYWNAEEKAWKLASAPAEVPLSRMPLSKELESLGKVTPFRQIGQAAEAVQEASEKPLFAIGGVNISAADINALALLGLGGYQGVRSLVPITKAVGDKAFQSALNIGLDRWITRRTAGIPPQHFQKAQDYLYGLVAKDRIWLQERARENMLRRMGRTPSNVPQAFREAVEDTIKEIEPRMLAKFTPGGSAVPGQTKPLAEIMATGVARLGAPAPIIKELSTPAATALLKQVQAEASSIGLDLEAVGGISPDEYWIALSANKDVGNELLKWQGRVAKTPEASKTLSEIVDKRLVSLRAGMRPIKGGFLPFKNIEDAQQFLATGDTSLILKKLELKGKPVSQEQIAQSQETLARRKEALKPLQPLLEEIKAKQAELAQIQAELTQIERKTDTFGGKAEIAARKVRNDKEAEIDALVKQYSLAEFKASPSGLPARPSRPGRLTRPGQRRGLSEAESEARLVALQAKMTPEEMAEFQISIKPEEIVVPTALEVTPAKPAKVAPTPTKGAVVTPEKATAVVSARATGQQIAQALGVKFDGVQEGLGMQFTDPQTGSTTYGNTLEEVKGKLAEMRGKFAEAEVTKEVVTPTAPAVETPKVVQVPGEPEARGYWAKDLSDYKPLSSGHEAWGKGQAGFNITKEGKVNLTDNRRVRDYETDKMEYPTHRELGPGFSGLYSFNLYEGEPTQLWLYPDAVNNLTPEMKNGLASLIGVDKITANTPVYDNGTRKILFRLKDTDLYKQTLALPKAEPGMPEPARAEGVPPKRIRPGKPPPPDKPVLPSATLPPEPTPPSGRPRTLADLNREAKGMRALKPDERAAIMDIARPISEGELLYQVQPFEEHARNLLQPDTPIKEALRSVPGVKQIVRLWTPAQMERDNPVAMIGVRKQIFEEIEIGRARLATLNWWHDADEAFDFKQVKGKWRVTNVELTASAQPSKPYHATIHDLVEHPENYNFTPAQQRVLQIAQDMQKQIMRDAQRAGVDAVELFNDYWRRIVIKAPSVKLDAKTRSRIAQRKGYTRQRVFDFVDEGANAGYEYETHPLTALQNRLEAGIRTISDQLTRQAIARLPGVEKPLERLESRYPQTVEGGRQARQARDAAKTAFLRDKTVENGTALRQAEADFVTAMREVYAKKLEAGQPNIGELKLPNGRIAPGELVDEVRKWVDLPELQTSVGTISNNVLEVTRLFRTTLTNVDLAAGFIQGQVLFYRNNVAWWRGQANALIALIDDPTAYVAKNFDLMDEGMRIGAISIPTEFLFTRQGLASIPTRIPIVGPVMKSFNRAFEWFILTGQTELYKAARGAAIKRAGGKTEQEVTDALVSLGSAIRKELGTESYAILGVRPNQHTLEQLVLFASRFFRALTGFQAQAFTGGEGGHEARRAWAAMLAGGLALTIAASYISEKELPNLTDPFKPGWLSFKIGKTYFNAFGPYYPYLRMEARVSIYVSQGKWDKAASELNRFMKSKAGLPLRGVDMAAQFGVKGYYTTFEGKTLPRTPLGIGEAVLGEMVVPISIQEALKSIPEGRPESATAEIFGLVGRENYPYFPEEMLASYFDIPSSAIELEAAKEGGIVQFSRQEYREEFPPIDAMLFLKGYVTTIKTDEAKQFVLDIIRREGYDPLQIRAVREWQKDEEKRQKLGLEDTSVSLTEELIKELLSSEETGLPAREAEEVSPSKSRFKRPTGGERLKMPKER